MLVQNFNNISLIMPEICSIRSETCHTHHLYHHLSISWRRGIITYPVPSGRQAAFLSNSSYSSNIRLAGLRIFCNFWIFTKFEEHGFSKRFSKDVCANTSQRKHLSALYSNTKANFPFFRRKQLSFFLVDIVICNFFGICLLGNVSVSFIRLAIWAIGFWDFRTYFFNLNR